MACGTFRLRPSLSLRSTELALNVAPIDLPLWHLKVAVATAVSASACGTGSAATQMTANAPKLKRRMMAPPLAPRCRPTSLPDHVDDPSRRWLDHNPLAVHVGIDVRRCRDRIDRDRRRQRCTNHHFSIDEDRLNHLLRYIGEDFRGRQDRLDHGWSWCHRDHRANRGRGDDGADACRHNGRNAELS